MPEYDEKIISQVAEIEKECFDDYWDYDSIANTLSYAYNKLYVEFAEDKVSGYLIANILGDESELLRIGVRKTNRRQKVASRLMRAYFDSMNDCCARYLLEVREGNRSARGLYELNGYKELAKRKAYYSNPKEDAIIYELLR